MLLDPVYNAFLTTVGQDQFQVAAKTVDTALNSFKQLLQC